MNPRSIFTFQHPTHNPTRSRTYTVNFFNTHITTVVTSTAAVARNWVYNLRNTHRDSLSDSSLVIGLGVQWRATFGPNPAWPTAATIQLSVGPQCLIFQLGHANSVPATLRLLLEDERVTFVGVHNGRDRDLLEDSWAELAVWNVVDVAKTEGFGNTSMEDMCGEVLGLHGTLKPREIGLSNWDDFWLSVDQVQYACVDAYVAYLLAVHLGYPKDDCYNVDDDDDDDHDDYNSDDYGGYGYGYGYDFENGYLDYEDYTNPYHYDSEWNYIG